MDQSQLKKYAKLLVKTGLNIQASQTLVVSCPVECAYFARVIAKEAYLAGAREVVMNWKDDLISRITLMDAPEDLFDEFPDYRKAFYIDLAESGACFLSIAASDPEVFKGVDPIRMKRLNKVSNEALAPYRERLMANKNAWCVASVPTEAWAAKVYADDSKEAAVEKLWDAIFKSVRVDCEDPVEAWNKHKAYLMQRVKRLNEYQFKSLQYKNGLGTDFTVFLAEQHIWLGVSDFTTEGVEFIANMPTEEVFTAPSKGSHFGKVVSSMPLNYNGNLINNFSLTFENGKVVDFSAQEGEEILKGLLDTDEGARCIGEVALVPYDSPISNLKTLFYNTLFDENASCHLALGKAYPVNIQGGDSMDKEELQASDINDSLVHVDFMIGTADLSVVGTTEDGRQIVVFENGNFAF